MKLLKSRRTPTLTALAIGGAVVLGVTAASAPKPEELAAFEREVRPVLAERCYSCHGPKLQQGGLRMDSAAALARGGKSGPALVPGHPERSRMIQAVNHQGLQMPPGSKLPEAQIQALTRWVKGGAVWPAAVKAAGALTWDEALAVRRDWWSLKPVSSPAVPVVKHPAWSQNPVDAFLLAEMTRRKVVPASRAEKRTLLRRLSLALTGLPPTPAELAAFVADSRPDAYQKQVERLLASPHYGENWARHWMDVVRYGETYGYEWNYEIRDAWRYRDYLIRAYNSDVPYDRLVKEHLAGDLLSDPRLNSEEQLNESAIGPAFLRFGEVGHDNFKEIGLDHLDNDIDTIGKAFQGATLSCARCHDHKLDAISTRDYYALLGVLASTRQVVRTIDTPDRDRAIRRQLAGIKTDLRKEMGKAWLAQLPDLEKSLQAIAGGATPTGAAATALKGVEALEHPLHPFQVGRTAPNLANAWMELRNTYTREQTERTAFNEKTFQVLGDFRNGVPAVWRVDGLGLLDGPVRSGDFALEDDGNKLVKGILPAGFYTHAVSTRLNGAIQGPEISKDKPFITFEALGGRNAAIKYVPDFRQLHDSGRELNSDKLSWIKTRRTDADEHYYPELVTKWENIRFPERGNKHKDAVLQDPRSYFGVTRVLVHSTDATPRADVDHVSAWLTPSAPADGAAAASQFTTHLRSLVERWSRDEATDRDVRTLNWALESGVLGNQLELSPQVKELATQYRQTALKLQPARVIAAVADVDRGFDYPVYQRGDHRSPGEQVQRRYLEVLGGATSPFRSGSGRLELAERIADPRNPLTARVYVNRIWHHLFGAGLVRTVDDFGHMGEAPSHPALLDWLATRFIREGWSTKQLIRLLVSTEAFRQSSTPGTAAAALDPENRLLHHFTPRRLPGEAIRDTILLVSGRLDRTLYGDSIDPHRPKPMPERRLFNGPVDGNGRRGLYIKNTLMELPPLLSVFNLPDAKIAQGRRDVTNVPAQALALLNDPFVVEQSEVWAKKLLKDPQTVAARLDRMSEEALGRPATPAEVQRFQTILRDLAVLHKVEPGKEAESLPLWKDVAHTFFNLKEFIYLK